MAARKPSRKRAKTGRKPAKKRPAAKSRGRARAAKKSPPRRAAMRAAAMPTVSPSAIGAWHHHLDYTSHDMAGIKRFYTEVLGFSVAMEDAKSGYLSIRTTPSTTIGFMPPMPGPPEQWRPPGEPALYFFVKDVDRVYRELSEKGIVFREPPADMPWGHRLTVCKDPEGRMVCIATDLSRSRG
jgi:predicted enzyme related to lactoylglutathione lyase